MQGEFVDALPSSILLAPDEDSAVVRGGSEYCAVFGVSPGNAPDGAFVTFECFGVAVLVSLDLEQFDRFVRGAGRQPSAVVVEDCVVLRTENTLDWRV